MKQHPSGRPGSRALLAGAALLIMACEDDPVQTPPIDDGGRDLVDVNPALDPDATPLRGPYLQAPAAGTVTVSWATSAPSTSRVAFGPEGGAQIEVEGITFIQVPTLDDEILAGTLPTAYQHEVALDDLVDGQTYTYRVLSAPSSTPEGRFVAPPGMGDDFRFFMLGDTRTHADDHAAVITGMATQMATDGHERAFVLHTGDFVTAGGIEGQWNTAFAIEAPIISRMPLLGVFGNHEAVLGRTIYEGIFKAPPTSGGTDRWYTVEIGDLILVVLDVYAPDLPEQIVWMELELARSPARFRILSLHVPLFTFSNHLPSFDLRDQLLPILAATGVQLVVNGHNHLYERFFGGGIHFVTAGGGGAPLYGTDDNPEADNTGATRRVSDSTLHFLAAEVAGPLLRIETFAVPDATRIDCFVIDADAPGAEAGCDP